MIYATCSDGVRRHSSGFAEPEDAVQWAQWGHFCAGFHTYTTDADDELPTQEDEEAAGDLEPLEIAVF